MKKARKKLSSFLRSGRDIIRERTIAGLEAARARFGNRLKGLSKQANDKAMIDKTLYAQGEMSFIEIHNYLNISKSTLY